MRTAPSPGSRTRRLVALLATILAVVLVRPLAAVPGDADPSFAGGRVTTDFGGTVDVVNALAVQVDGKVVAAGETRSRECTSEACSYDIALARYRIDGALDARFGSGGRVVTDLGGAEAAYALAIQPDGALLVAGVRGDEFVLLRYTVDGILDRRFDGDGFVTLALGLVERVNFSVALQDDGRILVAGATGFTLARFTADGQLDPSFGGTGRVGSGAGAGGAIGIAPLPDGDIFVATIREGTVTIRSFNADGSVDAAFGPDGVRDFGLGGGIDAATAFAGQLQSKLIAVGVREGGYALARFNLPDFSADPTFGAGGAVVLDRGGLRMDAVVALAAAEDGKIVVGGTAEGDFAVVRFAGAPPGASLLTESFDTAAGGALPGDTASPASNGAGYIGGEYVIRTLRPTDGPRGVYLPGVYADATIAVEARLLGAMQGRSIAVGCRDQSPGGYQLQIRPDGFAYLLVFGQMGPGRVLASAATPTLRLGGERNRIELTCAGTTISARINGARVLSATDATYRIGLAYLAVGVAPEYMPGIAEARFDNLTVVRTSPAAAGP